MDFSVATGYRPASLCCCRPDCLSYYTVDLPPYLAVDLAACLTIDLPPYVAVDLTAYLNVD
jgi:hypothetical protein